MAVIGAAGGAGSAAVDTALSLGGRVIGIGHSSQESYLRGLGVAQFLAYDKEDVAGKVREVDVVLNMVDNQADAGMGICAAGGRQHKSSFEAERFRPGSFAIDALGSRAPH